MPPGRIDGHAYLAVRSLGEIELNGAFRPDPKKSCRRVVLDQERFADIERVPFGSIRNHVLRLLSRLQLSRSYRRFLRETPVVGPAGREDESVKHALINRLEQRRPGGNSFSILNFPSASLFTVAIVCMPCAPGCTSVTMTDAWDFPVVAFITVPSTEASSQSQ